MDANTALSGQLRLQHTQQLVLSVEMRQSLAILQMPVYELSQFLAQKRSENPFLELDERSAQDESDDSFATVPLAAAQSEETTYEWDELPRSFHAATRAAGHLEYRPELLYKAEELSLFDALTEQLQSLNLSRQQYDLCCYLVHCLNERGYLEFELSDIAHEIGADLFSVTQALYVVQSLEPLGVGARSLSECLMIQLAQSPCFAPETIHLVKDGLPLLARGNMQALAKLLGCSPKKAAACADAVRGLNPIPARGYYTGERTQYIVPDAAVQREDGNVHIVLNQGAGTKVELSQEYIGLLSQALDSKTRTYLGERYAEAKALVRAIHDRSVTLERVLDGIVKLQMPYFEEGATLRPMTMKELADQLGLHVSTVSRAVKDKYIRCQAGVISLKSLFSTGVSTAAQDAVSNIHIKHKITQLVGAEDNQRPLSDEALRTALRAMGIDISRRTVAKYRDQMGIPSASQRKNNRMPMTIRTKNTRL